MAASNFDRTMVNVIFPNEGGFVNDPRDPGGATNLGVTRATLAAYRGENASVADVKALQKPEAIEIYRKQYAAPIAFDGLPNGLDCAMLDFAVNSGAAKATKTLQTILGIAADGVMGPKTLAALDGKDAVVLIRRLSDDRLAFLRKLKTWRTFGSGWTSRVNRVERVAVAMIQGGAKASLPLLATPAAAAKAKPSDTAFSGTKHGKAILLTAAGAASTAIGQAKDAIEPYTAASPWIEKAFVCLTVLGVVGALAGIAFSAVTESNRIASGAPVG